jgi:hypothetical protein
MNEFLKKLGDKVKQLILTLVGKKYVVLTVGTLLLAWGKLSGEVWLGLAMFVIGANSYDKKQHLENPIEGK